jgi:hypothetical protein
MVLINEGILLKYERTGRNSFDKKLYSLISSIKSKRSYAFWKNGRKLI